MTDQTPETVEQPEQTTKETTKPLSSKGITSIQGETQAVQDDLENYEEQLFKHKSRMQEIGNQSAAAETEEEIQKVDRQLYETVQKKYGVKPGAPESSGE